MTGPEQACDDQRLAMFGAGELDADRRDEVTAHLVDCDRCWDAQRAQRLAVGAVQQLWEPAPAGLRADLRAAVTASARSRSGPAHRRSRRGHLVGIAAGLAVLTAGGLATTQLTRGGPSSAVPGSVQAAIAQAASAPRADSLIAPAPALDALGLRLTAAGSTEAPGVHTEQYRYLDRGGRPLTLFVAAQAWPRPQRAADVSRTAWSIAPGEQTVIGGVDQAGDNMLLVAPDHDTAMTAAKALGLVPA